MRIFRRRQSLALTAAVVAMWFGSLQAGDLNPAAIAYKLPDQIKWVENASGSKTATVFGDPTKPGLYVMLTKWTPNHGSRPHFHPFDRCITVLSGTWWVGTGPKYDPDHMVPMPAGTVVTHFGNQIHYDGAKDGEVLLEIVGLGPNGSTPAEEK